MSTCHGCGAELPPKKKPGRARKWCSDRCRKTQYSRPCTDCGAPLSGSDGHGPNAPTRCARCAAKAAKIWTRDSIIAAINAWADSHGGIPPVATDWNSTLAARRGTPRPDGFPSTGTVYMVFGTWRAAIEAAGFEPFSPGHYGRPGDDSGLVEMAVEMYRNGMPSTHVQEELGVSYTTILRAAREAGVPIRGRWGEVAA